MQPQLGVGIGLDHERLAPGRGPRSVDRAENGHWSERGQFLLVPDYGRETVHDHGETERAEKACDGGQQDDQLPRRADPFAGGGCALDDSQLSRRRCRAPSSLEYATSSSATAFDQAARVLSPSRTRIESRRVTSLAVTSSSLLLRLPEDIPARAAGPTMRAVVAMAA